MPHQGGNGLVRPPEVNWEGEPASRFPLPTLATKIRGSLLPFTTDFLIGAAAKALPTRGPTPPWTPLERQVSRSSMGTRSGRSRRKTASQRSRGESDSLGMGVRDLESWREGRPAPLPTPPTFYPNQNL